MPFTTVLRLTFPGLALGALLCAGCISRPVNPDITDPAAAKKQFAADQSLCKALANDTVPPTYGLERYSVDPTYEAQADQFVANAVEDDAHQDVFTRCMRDRGWRYK